MTLLLNTTDPLILNVLQAWVEIEPKRCPPPQVVRDTRGHHYHRAITTRPVQAKHIYDIPSIQSSEKVAQTTFAAHSAVSAGKH